MKSQKPLCQVCKSAKVQNLRNYKVIKLKNNCRKVCLIQEKSVPLHHRCKTDISIRKMRHSQREKFS